MLKDNIFKKINGEKVTDIIGYIKEHMLEDPYLTIAVGCDSVHRKKILYVITITMYNSFLKRGVHIISKKVFDDAQLDTFSRLYRESEYIKEVADYICENIDIERKDIDEFSKKEYKFHSMNVDGKYDHIPYYNQEAFIKNLVLTDEEQNKKYNFVDLHVDYNPVESSLINGVYRDHKSYAVLNSALPYLRGLNYRVWCKPILNTATRAADAIINKAVFNKNNKENNEPNYSRYKKKRKKKQIIIKKAM